MTNLIKLSICPFIQPFSDKFLRNRLIFISDFYRIPDRPVAQQLCFKSPKIHRLTCWQGLWILRYIFQPADQSKCRSKEGKTNERQNKNPHTNFQYSHDGSSGTNHHKQSSSTLRVHPSGTWDGTLERTQR